VAHDPFLRVGNSTVIALGSELGGQRCTRGDGDSAFFLHLLLDLLRRADV